MGITRQSMCVLVLAIMILQSAVAQDASVTPSAPVATSALVATGTADTTNANEVTNYTCNTNGVMTVTVPDWVKGVQVICTAKDTPTSSPGTTVPPGTATIHGTQVTIENCKKDSNATLVLLAQPLTTPTSASSILKRKEQSAQVILKCTAKADANWTQTVQFQIIGPTLQGSSAEETPEELTAKIWTTGNSSAEATEVTLGGSYVIVISGDEPYYKKVQSCNASGTEGGVANGIDVLGKTVNEANSTQNDTWRSGITHTSPHDMFLSLTGFRLVGSSTVYLQCSVGICKHDQCVHDTRKRKRAKVRYATMKFDVKNEILDTSTSGTKGFHSTTRHFVVLLLVTVLGYQTF